MFFPIYCFSTCDSSVPRGSQDGGAFNRIPHRNLGAVDGRKSVRQHLCPTKSAVQALSGKRLSSTAAHTKPSKHPKMQAAMERRGPPRDRASGRGLGTAPTLEKHGTGWQSEKDTYVTFSLPAADTEHGTGGTLLALQPTSCRWVQVYMTCIHVFLISIRRTYL
jgi:hypothetical protein